MWKFKDTMKMLRQYHPAMYFEWMPGFDFPDRFPQRLDVPHQQIVAFPLQKVDGKKIGATRVPNTSVRP